MGQDKKGKKGGSKAGMALALLLFGLVGAGAVGFYFPQTPYIGPFVGMVFKQASLTRDSSGVFEVRITEVRFADEEFKPGEELDLQVKIYRLDAEGKPVKPAVLDTTDPKLGERLGEAGSKERPPVARWPDNPFKIDWKTGDEFLIEIWDLQGGDTRLVEWRTEKSSGFPLGGTVTFLQVSNSDVKKAKGSYISFDAKPTGAK